MADIVLSTLNARYIHASLGLRYLRANLGSYRERSVVCEFTIKRPIPEIVKEILQLNPRVVGFGVYIWNTDATLEVVRQLKVQRPELLIVLGGPEVSFETESQALYTQADFVFKGEADLSFKNFIEAWFARNELPQTKLISAPLPPIITLHFPYGEYTDEDLKNRVLYVEASRGCPYKCEYCLSALDISVRNFNCENFLNEMRILLERGARQFKFVDRTFNLAPATSSRILEFFLEHIHLGLFLHFEMVPDRLPENLKLLIQKFPAGALQFEIGIQTWNPEVARNVSRRQDYQKIDENLRFLNQSTGVHTHADLIVGLPGETWLSFAHGFNALYALAPDEIQVGLLKRLKGTPIIRHDEKFHMKYDTKPPFQILQNKDLSAEEIKKLKIFADFWGLIANSGRFPGMKEIARASQQEPFEFYYDLSQALFSVFGRTHSIHLTELETAVGIYLEDRGLKKLEAATRAIAKLPKRQALHQAARSIILLFCLLAFSSSLKAEEPLGEQPLWELGIGGGGTYTPDYPGSDQSHFWGIPFPYGVYRGEILHSDRRGETRARFFKSASYEFNFSAGGGLPSSSSKNHAREGMPDLEYLGELGPRLMIDLVSYPESSLLRIGLPVRFAFSTNVQHLTDRGLVFAPELLYDRPNILGKGYDAFVLLTVNFADRRFSGYFYGVTPEYATAQRRPYSAKAGYFDTDASIGLSVPFASTQVKLLTFASFSSLNGAVNESSPLFRAPFNASFSVIAIWTFAKSSVQVVTND